MLKITDKLWIGNSDDEKQSSYYHVVELVKSVLIVAHDMQPTNGWDGGVEYMQVGIVDGPGNQLATYHAAVLALVAMTRKGRVLVCCHDGGRSLAIVIMYLYLMGNGPSWDEHINRLSKKEANLPLVHNTHKKAFFLMDWGMLTRVIDGEV